ncbi:MAG TPA: hypothetical protein VK489_02265 [Ferruginibacter sp.]|nr:hypothetical protein [Ferruginibacter sp.]
MYKEWRLMFWLLLLFVVGQFFFMAKGIQNVPFFLYYMYSQKHPPKDSIAVYLIKTSTGYYDHKKLSSREQELLMNSVGYYVNLKRDGDGINETIKKRFGKITGKGGLSYLQEQLVNDSSALLQFPEWWGRYFQTVVKNKFDSVSVVRSYVSTAPPYNKSATDSLVFTIKLK